jgi:hypothetical protein
VTNHLKTILFEILCKQFAYILDIEPKLSGDKPFKTIWFEILCKQFANILDIEPKPSGEKPFTNHMV